MRRVGIGWQLSLLPAPAFYGMQRRPAFTAGIRNQESVRSSLKSAACGALMVLGFQAAGPHLAQSTRQCPGTPVPKQGEHEQKKGTHAPCSHLLPLSPPVQGLHPAFNHTLCYGGAASAIVIALAPLRLSNQGTGDINTSPYKLAQPWCAEGQLGQVKAF